MDACQRSGPVVEQLRQPCATLKTGYLKSGGYGHRRQTLSLFAYLRSPCGSYRTIVSEARRINFYENIIYGYPRHIECDIHAFIAKMVHVSFIFEACMNGGNDQGAICNITWPELLAPGIVTDYFFGDVF